MDQDTYYQEHHLHQPVDVDATFSRSILGHCKPLAFRTESGREVLISEIGLVHPKYDGLKTIDAASAGEVKRESVVIVTLLHDVCKTDIYKRTIKKRKNKLGQWEDAEGYNVSYKDFPMGHGEKSVIMLLLSGLDLHDDEMLAIRWHMGAFGLNMNSYEDERCYDTARQEYPLCCIVQSADSLAAAIMETTQEDRDNL